MIYNSVIINKDGIIYFILFVCTIYLANYLIHNFGTICPPNSPCLIPVWPGIMAPSGVLAAGIGFTLRDLVQRRLGLMFTCLAILIGALISALLSPSLAFASGVAFLLSEFIDLAVYTPLQNKNLIFAVFFSNIVGLLIDSVVFLWLAFKSLQFIEGQIIGKFWMTLLALPIVWLFREWDKKKGTNKNGA